MRRIFPSLVVVTLLFLLSSESISATRLLTDVTEDVDEERVGVQDEKELSAKLTEWLLQKKHPQEVLHLLQLVPKHGDVKDVLNHPKFKSWLRYIEDFRNKNPDTVISPRSILIDQYNEDKVTAAIDSLNPLRKQLYNELQPRWRYDRNIHQSPQPFHPIQTLHHHDFIQYWVDYTNRFNSDKLSETSITSILRANFYDRDILTIVQDVTPATTNNKATAKKVQEDILEDWINLRKTPYEALVELQLNNPSQIPFANPLYGLWFEYVKSFNREWTKFRMSHVEAFLRWYSPSELAESLSSVKSYGFHVKKAARVFNTKLLDHWLSHKKSPEDLYKELKLDVNFYSRASADLFFSYLNRLVTQPRGADVLTRMVEAFPKDIFKILRKARGFHIMRDTANQLLTAHGDNVLRDKVISPTEAFKYFELGSIGDHLLSHPLFKKWLEYSKNFEQEHPGVDSSWLTILTASYNDYEISEMVGRELVKTKEMEQEVADALIKLRLESITDPYKFFVSLGLRKAVTADNFLSNPTFYVWNKYFIEFNKKYPDKNHKIIGFIDSRPGLRTAMAFSNINTKRLGG